MISSNRPLQSQSLASLARRCSEETEAFFRRKEYDPQFCYEIFRRALVDREPRAYDSLYRQYQPLVAGWIERHGSFSQSGEEVQYFINRTFEKFWQAVTAEKFQRFADLKALLSYLRMCTYSVLIDHARTRERAQKEIDFDTAPLSGYASELDVEQDAILQDQRLHFWRLIHERLFDDKERIVIHSNFVLDMKPAEVQRRYPHLFNEVKDVYRIKQNVLERLRRDPALREALRL